jgi:hypothetical protein
LVVLFYRLRLCRGRKVFPPGLIRNGAGHVRAAVDFSGPDMVGIPAINEEHRILNRVLDDLFVNVFLYAVDRTELAVDVEIGASSAVVDAGCFILWAWPLERLEGAGCLPPGGHRDPSALLQ